MAYNLAAMELWDDQAWFELASGQAELARATGTLPRSRTPSTTWQAFTSKRESCPWRLDS